MNDNIILSLTGFTQLLSASQETVASSRDALLSKKERSDSPNLSTSEPDVRSIRRYSRESLLSLRNSELSKRKPEQLHFGRAWVRIGVSSEGKIKRSPIFHLKPIFVQLILDRYIFQFDKTNCRSRGPWKR